MPPQSRGGHVMLSGHPPPLHLPSTSPTHHPRPSAVPHGAQSRSTPNLPTLRSLERSSGSNSSSATASIHNATSQKGEATSPSEAASIDDFSLESTNDPHSLSDDDEEEHTEQADEEAFETRLPPRPLPYRSRSHTYLSQAMFAPPFYGRPPTPLPPSPSLTSLLRPNFSSANSRPTTPDPSSDEGGTPRTHTNGAATGTQTPNSAAASTLTSSLRISAKPPVQRASPKVPTYEYYGFTLYLTSSLAFVVYLLWSFLPAPFLHQLGIWYYPDRWWALAIPAWTVMLVLYIYVALASYNTEYLTLGMGSVECLVDEAANVAVLDAGGKVLSHEQPQVGGAGERSPDKKRGRKGGKGKSGRRSRQGSPTKMQQTRAAGHVQGLDWRTLWNEGTDAVMDIPIGGVCEILYGSRYEN